MKSALLTLGLMASQATTTDRIIYPAYTEQKSSVYVISYIADEKFPSFISNQKRILSELQSIEGLEKIVFSGLVLKEEMSIKELTLVQSIYHSFPNVELVPYSRMDLTESHFDKDIVSDKIAKDTFLFTLGKLNGSSSIALIIPYQLLERINVGYRLNSTRIEIIDTLKEK